MNSFAILGIKLLEGLFLIGVLGALAVFAVSLVEDAKVILEKDEPAQVVE